MILAKRLKKNMLSKKKLKKLEEFYLDMNRQ